MKYCTRNSVLILLLEGVPGELVVLDICRRVIYERGIFDLSVQASNCLQVCRKFLL